MHALNERKTSKENIHNFHQKHKYVLQHLQIWRPLQTFFMHLRLLLTKSKRLGATWISLNQIFAFHFVESQSSFFAL